MYNPARNRAWDGISSRFGKMKWPAPNLTRWQKMALVLGTAAILYYDWCIGPVMDPIIRLIVAVFCAWYVVIIFSLFNFAWKRIVPKGMETHVWQYMFKGISRVILGIGMLQLASPIMYWLADRLGEQGGLNSMTFTILNVFKLICLLAIPVLWFIKPTPTSSA